MPFFISTSKYVIRTKSDRAHMRSVRVDNVKTMQKSHISLLQDGFEIFQTVDDHFDPCKGPVDALHV